MLKIENLKTYFFVKDGVIKAVDDVSFNLKKGETLGLVGESGCGKSTLGLSILRLVSHPGKIVGGKILFNGENLLEKTEEEMRKIRGKKISMIFQDPMTSLNPIKSIQDHITETILVHEKITKAEALKKTEKLFDSLGISRERLKEYPHQFSGGMKQRIMIGLALVLKPQLIIADEPTTALDVIVQANILRLLKDLEREYNLTLILITHDLSVAAELCSKIAVMYAGKLVEIAEAEKLYETPLHPYSEGLLKSIPNIDSRDRTLRTISGSPPDLLNRPKGCAFHPRCKYVKGICKREVPILKKVGSTEVACHLR